MLLSAIRACVGHERQRDNFAIFLRPTEQICPDSAGPFHSFDPVGFAIFATSASIPLRAGLQPALARSAFWFATSRCCITGPVFLGFPPHRLARPAASKPKGALSFIRA